MSKDRVHFYITATISRQIPVCGAFQEAFGRECPKVHDFDEPVKIICRPSQFARFLIYRDQRGGTNGFKCLNASLVAGCEPKWQLDVSGNPAESASVVRC